MTKDPVAPRGGAADIGGVIAPADVEDRRWRLPGAALILPQALSKSVEALLPLLDGAWFDLAQSDHLSTAGGGRVVRSVHSDDGGLVPSRRWATLLKEQRALLERTALDVGAGPDFSSLSKACSRSLLVASSFLSLEAQELAGAAPTSGGEPVQRRLRETLRDSDDLAEQMLRHARAQTWRSFLQLHAHATQASARHSSFESDLNRGSSGGSAELTGSTTQSPAWWPKVTSWSSSQGVSEPSTDLEGAAKMVRAGWRHYEVLVILAPHLDERSVAPSLEVFLNVVREDGGLVDNVEVWGRRRLTYEIEENAEGIYAVLDLRCEAHTVKEVDRQLSFNESVLKTKIMRRDPNADARRGKVD